MSHASRRVPANRRRAEIPRFGRAALGGVVPLARRGPRRAHPTVQAKPLYEVVGVDWTIERSDVGELLGLALMALSFVILLEILPL